MVLNGEVDLAMSNFGISQVRYEVIDFLQFQPPIKSFICIRNPKETFDWEVYTKPLRKEAWLGLGLFVLLVPLLMMILMMNGKIECK